MITCLADYFTSLQVYTLWDAAALSSLHNVQFTLAVDRSQNAERIEKPTVESVLQTIMGVLPYNCEWTYSSLSRVRCIEDASLFTIRNVRQIIKYLISIALSATTKLVKDFTNCTECGVVYIKLQNKSHMQVVETVTLEMAFRLSVGLDESSNENS